MGEIVCACLTLGNADDRDGETISYLTKELYGKLFADKGGCFSGSAVEMLDGQQLLMYTGVHLVREDDGRLHDLRVRCVAIGNSIDYNKYPDNPVITADDLSEGGSPIDFRDPKLYGNYYAVIGNHSSDGSGAILLYRSKNCLPLYPPVGTIGRLRN